MTLRKLSSLTVVEYGIAWNEVPQPLHGELGKLEEMIKSDLTGNFLFVTEASHIGKLKIDWSGGEWRFTISNQPSISIRAGRRECLGLPGGELFLFKENKIFIDDVRIDLEGRRIMFYGICSSINDSDGSKFKSSISLLKYNSKDVMKMKSEVVGECGQVKVKERRYCSLNVNCIDFMWIISGY